LKTQHQFGIKPRTKYEQGTHVLLPGRCGFQFEKSQ